MSIKWKKSFNYEVGNIKSTAPFILNNFKSIIVSQGQKNLDYIKNGENQNQRKFRGVSNRVSNSFYNKAKKGSLNPIKHPRISYTKINYNLNEDCNDCSNNYNFGNDIVYLVNGFVDNSNCNCKDDVTRNELSNYQPVVLNNPARITRPKSSQTLLKKNYYSDTRNYLKSRVKLYEQNQLLSKKVDNPLIQNNGQPINPRLPPSSTNWVYADNNKRLGSQSFNSTYCISDPSSCCPNSCKTNVTFKPNNPFFAQQGAVDSSTRILQAKYKTITKNNYNFNLNQVDLPAGKGLYVYSVAGDKNSEVIKLPGATPQKYRGESYRSQAPYFIKNKYQKINNCTNGYFISSHIAELD